MAYSKAINDGIVKDNQTNQYLDTIYHQSNILKNRVDDMMLYATLEEHMEENMQKNSQKVIYVMFFQRFWDDILTSRAKLEVGTV